MYDGTWSGQAPVPREVLDFELMNPDSGMGWSWQELEATPSYVRRFCLDLLGVRRRAEAQRQDKAGGR